MDHYWETIVNYYGFSRLEALYTNERYLQRTHGLDVVYSWIIHIDPSEYTEIHALLIDYSYKFWLHRVQRTYYVGFRLRKSIKSSGKKVSEGNVKLNSDIKNIRPRDELITKKPPGFLLIKLSRFCWQNGMHSIDQVRLGWAIWLDRLNDWTKSLRMTDFLSTCRIKEMFVESTNLLLGSPARKTL